MKKATCKISAYMSEEELEKFHKMKDARGDLTVSGYIREMLGFDIRPLGTPPGPRKKKESQEEQTKAKPAENRRKSPKRAPKERVQLSFLD